MKFNVVKMEKVNKSNHLAVVIGSFFIILIAGINAALLNTNYSCYGVYIFLSFLVSIVGSLPALLNLFLKSEILLVTLIKVVTLFTFVSQGFVEESRSLSSNRFCNVYFYLNLVVIPLNVFIIIREHQNHYKRVNQQV